MDELPKQEVIVGPGNQTAVSFDKFLRVNLIGDFVDYTNTPSFSHHHIRCIWFSRATSPLDLVMSSISSFHFLFFFELWIVVCFRFYFSFGFGYYWIWILSRNMVSKQVKDVMSIATGHEREELQVEERSKTFLRFADLVEKHNDALAALETWDNGKPYEQSANVEVSMFYTYSDTMLVKAVARKEMVMQLGRDQRLRFSTDIPLFKKGKTS